MITCHRSHVESRCRERGYTLEEVMPCVVAQDGEQWTVDVDHAAYPRVSRLPDNKQQPATPASGPGTELKKLLAAWPFRFVAGDDCKCKQRARYMDQMGCDWVEANIEECVGYLRESAADRGLPFLDAAGRLLIRRAIGNARKASA